ncbi:hypothetical protein C2869_06025 [Saccharobesus litoralis]|uniref:DUF1410 domain-containing protein n=1 Tax=Saccharobesus litoralis TaxID=2172099 RepID=A0A2S0VPA5_9ALTE|nr:DUF1800 family protein [Saccharobesus litoralis]AWB66022.1 hypothetical protein C2869_06025 [Saccharobesus litoralis]
MKTQSNALRKGLRNTYRLICKVLLWTSIMVLLPTQVLAADLVINLLDAKSNTAISGDKITLLQIQSDNSREWYARATTDDAGQAHFEIDADYDYVAYSEYFSEFRAYSDVITDLVDNDGASNQANLVIGNLTVNLLDGSTAEQAAMADTRVYIRQKLVTGKSQYLGRAKSDANGVVRLTLPEPTADTPYILQAKSLTSGVYKYSPEITSLADTQFVVGNLPLNVKLLDASNNQAIAETRIAVYEQLKDGSRKGRGNATTNDNGIAVFDLDGIGQGRQYYFSAKVFNQFQTYSAVQSQPGSINWPIGTVQVNILNGGIPEQSGLADTTVEVYRIEDTKKHWIGRAVSNAQGQIKIDLTDVDSGQPYVLRAYSPSDNSKKYSQTITSSGQHDFVVGNLPLNVTLRDGISQQVISNQQITVTRLDENGKRHWLRRATTDANGQLVLDLDGLGQGTHYQLQTQYFAGQWTYSPPISQTGDFTFDLGTTAVTLRNGNLANNSVLAGHKIWLYKLLEDGSRQYVQHTTSDDNGVLRFNLDPNAKYQLKTTSPSNSKLWAYYDVSGTGEQDLAVGNPFVLVKVKQATSSQALANIRVDAYRVDSAGKLHGAGSLTTDQNGLAAFDLAGIGSGSEFVFRTRVYNNFPVYSALINQPGEVNLNLGSMQISMLDGSQTPASALANQPVYIHRIMLDGKKHGMGYFNTDDGGLLQLDKSPNVAQYVLTAKSTIDGQTRYYFDAAQAGDHTFTVGTLPFNVSIKDARSTLPISEQRIDVSRWDSEQNRFRWFSRAYTNAAGQVAIDLPGVNSGSQYRLVTQVYNDMYLYSDPISASGSLEWNVGKTLVNVLDGSQDAAPPLTEQRVYIEKLNDQGKFRYYSRANTDVNGQLRIDLPDLGSGSIYRLKAQSAHGVYKVSQSMQANGDYEFVVGNPAVTVSLTDYMSGQPLAAVKIAAQRLNDEGNWVWAHSVMSDENGLAVFDLDNINQGAEYRLAAKAYNGIYAYSQTISAPGDVNFTVGSLPVELVNQDSGDILVGKTITLYRIDGQKLHWTTRSATDESGQVRFDPSGLYDGERFVVRVHNPFGNNKNYYGPIVNQPGFVRFAVSENSPTRVDLIAPDISITAPSEGLAYDQGFMLQGIATDNNSVADIRVQLASNGTVVQTYNVLHNSQTGMWQQMIDASVLAGLQDIQITATANDYALNQASVMANYQVQADIASPSLQVTSHGQQQAVNVSGFTLAGSVTDDIGVQSLTLNLIDGALGTTIANQPVGFNPETGLWSYSITSGLVSDSQRIDIQLLATDIAGKQTQYDLALFAIAAELNPLHLLSRITFGATPDLINRVYQGESELILQEQLAPDNIDDSVFLASLPSDNPQTLDELKQRLLQHMLTSPKQLQEVMAWFWENHFNTNYHTSRNVDWEWRENQGFRQHALGNFRDLLEVSAKSPAMIYYLNNAQNVAGAANENYAREILELHTMGEGNGYTAQDIAELARIFTGWHEQDGDFFFNQDLHDFGDKSFLGQTILGTGLDEGEQVLDILTTHSSTAEYLCSKLLMVFVDEDPLPALQSQCEAEWIASSANMTAVLSVILSSDEFGQAGETRAKVKTPLELVTSVGRNFQADVDLAELADSVDDLGMRLFEFPVPTGFSEEGADWLNTNALAQRARFVSRGILNSQDGIEVDVITLLQTQGYQSDTAIIAYLADLALAGNLSDVERNLAVGILSPDDAFNWQHQDAEHKVRRLMAFMLSLPAYQYQ